jgi:tRNA-dihydrouridine synthase A
MLERRFSVAPMMDCTDRHFRQLARLLSRRALLYTEMITTGALLRGDAARHLRYAAGQNPLALQLGGSIPEELAQCAQLAQQWGYDEVNLNCGCPSDRVQQGRIGACLMAEPALVADCVRAMRAQVDIAVTVKTRIGIDDMDDYNGLARLVEQVAAAGCEVFIVHARKAWLKGLSPHQNRTVPPLNYASVHRLKREFSQLSIVINGGIDDLDAAQLHLDAGLDGVMLGRAAYAQPYLLAEVDQRLYGDDRPVPSRHAVVQALWPYLQAELAQGTPLAALTRHLLGLFQGVPGARAFRRLLSERACHPGADLRVLREALAQLRLDESNRMSLTT